MLSIIDRLSVAVSRALGLDPCVSVCWLRWVLSWDPEVRLIRREILRRLVASQ